MGGHALTICIQAPERIRRKRVASREASKSTREVEQMLKDDREKEDLALYQDFDVIVRNHGNETSQATRQVSEAVEKFMLKITKTL